MSSTIVQVTSLSREKSAIKFDWQFYSQGWKVDKASFLEAHKWFEIELKLKL